MVIVYWNKKGFRTATKRPYNDPGKGESIGSPFLVFERVILNLNIQLDIQFRYSFEKV